MKILGRTVEGHARALAILVSILLVSSGLCGVQLSFANKIYNSQGVFGFFFMITGLLELIAIGLSAIGIVIVLIAWLISKVFGTSASDSKTERGFYITSQGDDHGKGLPTQSKENEEAPH